MNTVEKILELFHQRGDSEYGGEPVTQLQHALQAASLAEQSGASSSLITASLLHDVGHLLHDLADDAPECGIDDHHEKSGYHFLKSLFSDAVCEPVRMHVAAKRYLCAIDQDYWAQLSDPSKISLQLQGGPMSDDEAKSFRELAFAEDATRLRRWDDQAKVVDRETAPLSHFEKHLRQALDESSQQ